MALFAHHAAAARLRRVHRHPGAHAQGLVVAVVGIGSHGLHHAGELVAQHQGLLHHGVADAAVVVGMQVAAADAHRGDAEARHAGAGRAWDGNPLDAEVVGAVQADGQHRVRAGATQLNTL